MSGVTPLFILMESHYGSQRWRQRAMNQLLCYEIKIELLATPNPYPSWEMGRVGSLGEGCYPGVALPNHRAGSRQAASEGDTACLHLVFQTLPPQPHFPSAWR